MVMYLEWKVYILQPYVNVIDGNYKNLELA